MNLKKAAAALPSDRDSRHWNLRDSSLKDMFLASGKIEQHIVKMLVVALPQHKLDTQPLPDVLIQLRAFVKGKDEDCQMLGVGNMFNQSEAAGIVNYLPFASRCFLLYMADFVCAIELAGMIDQQPPFNLTFPYTKEVMFLKQMYGVNDTNRCCSNDVLRAMEPLRPL